jgi:exonuclease SbcC
LKFTKLKELLAGYNTIFERVREFSSAEEEDAERVRGLEVALSGRKEAEDKIKAASEEHGRLNNELIEAELSFEQQRKYLTDLTELKGKAKCPRCGQALTSEHLSREVTAAEKAIIAAKEAIARVKASEPDVKRKVEELARIVEEFRNKDAELKNLKRALEKKKADKDRLNADLDRIHKELKARGYAGEKLSDIEAKVSEYNNLIGKMELLEKRLASEGEIREKISAASDEYKTKSRRREEFAKELEGVIFSQDELDEAEKQREELIEKKYAVEGEVKEIDFRLRENRKGRDELEEKKRGFMELKKEFEKSEARLHLLSRAREVFHTDKGIPKYLRDKYISTLGLTLTNYFRRFNENPAYKEAYFDKDYGIRVKATHGELSLEQLSGGEKVQLAVALRIALIEMLSPIRLLILDEPFGSLDIEHRELLGETLNKMSSGWQLILVTHVHVDSLQLESIQLEGY